MAQIVVFVENPCALAGFGNQLLGFQNMSVNHLRDVLAELLSIEHHALVSPQSCLSLELRLYDLLLMLLRGLSLLLIILPQFVLKFLFLSS